MAIHPSFPTSPHEVPTPDYRFVDIDDLNTLRNLSELEASKTIIDP